MKPTVIDPKTTTRAAAFDLWMSAPNPMVTFFKTLDVTPLVRFSRKRGLKFNMLLCWCIGKAASEIKEFYTLPIGRELMQYDSIAVNTILYIFKLAAIHKLAQLIFSDTANLATSGTWLPSASSWKPAPASTTSPLTALLPPSPPFWAAMWTP